jgi:meso-butanediol dehydrogenase / (S,S)-butanediol dehydrogenase / diacetyl reductase
MTDREPRELEGRVAAITGAGSGLGAAIARQCADAGMAVAALDIDEARARATADELAALGGPAFAARVDVGDADSTREAVRLVDERFGGVDLLFANVGVQQFGSIERLTDDDWTWVLGVNVIGTVRTVTSFLPVMRRRGGWRHITVTASSGVFVPSVRLAAYTASKLAVVGFAETLREELEDDGIEVTIVFPAGMMTRHLESSALARPDHLGESRMMPDDIEAMLGSRAGSPPDDVLAPEDAIRGLLDDLVAGERYFITHGAYRADYEVRLAALDRAFERMESRASGTRASVNEPGIPARSERATSEEGS